MDISRGVIIAASARMLLENIEDVNNNPDVGTIKEEDIQAVMVYLKQMATERKLSKFMIANTVLGLVQFEFIESMKSNPITRLFILIMAKEIQVMMDLQGEILEGYKASHKTEKAADEKAH